MNIPLNIDWQQILLHLFNFLILAFGLYFLLYKPVKKFMNTRIGYFEELEKEAKTKLEETTQAKADYESKIADVDDEISKKRSKAAKEAEKAANDRIRSAKLEAIEIIENAKKSAEKEKTRIVEDAQKEIAALAVAATEKLIASQSDSLNQFISVSEGSEDK